MFSCFPTACRFTDEKEVRASPPKRLPRAPRLQFVESPTSLHFRKFLKWLTIFTFNHTTKCVFVSDNTPSPKASLSRVLDFEEASAIDSYSPSVRREYNKKLTIYTFNHTTKCVLVSDNTPSPPISSPKQSQPRRKRRFSIAAKIRKDMSTVVSFGLRYYFDTFNEILIYFVILGTEILSFMRVLHWEKPQTPPVNQAWKPTRSSHHNISGSNLQVYHECGTATRQRGAHASDQEGVWSVLGRPVDATGVPCVSHYNAVLL